MIHQYKNIVYLDDLLRHDSWRANLFIYNIISAGLSQGTGAETPLLDNFPESRGLTKNFSLQKFKSLCGEPEWTKVYFSIPRQASDYLLSCLPKYSLVIGYEMPPWLFETLSENKIPSISIRISPIRFSRDLYFDIYHTGIESINDHIDSVSEQEISIEAGIIKASIIHNQKNDEYNKKYANSILYIGQTRIDASKIIKTRNGSSVASIADYKEKICNAIENRNILYKPHPYDQHFSKEEIIQLKKITGKNVTLIKTNIYTTLSVCRDLKYLTISSGSAMEASYFSRASHSLHTPWFYNNNLNKVLIRSEQLLCPYFWSKISNSGVKTIQIPHATPNLLRSRHNSYWGYDDYLLANDQFWFRVVHTGIKNLVKFYATNLKNRLSGWRKIKPKNN